MPRSEAEALEQYLDCLADCLEDGTMSKNATIQLLRHTVKRLGAYTRPKEERET